MAACSRIPGITGGHKTAAATGRAGAGGSAEPTSMMSRDSSIQAQMRKRVTNVTGHSTGHVING